MPRGQRLAVVGIEIVRGGQRVLKHLESTLGVVLDVGSQGLGKILDAERDDVVIRSPVRDCRRCPIRYVGQFEGQRIHERFPIACDGDREFVVSGCDDMLGLAETVFDEPWIGQLGEWTSHGQPVFGLICGELRFVRLRSDHNRTVLNPTVSQHVQLRRRLLTRQLAGQMAPHKSVIAVMSSVRFVFEMPQRPRVSIDDELVTRWLKTVRIAGAVGNADFIEDRLGAKLRLAISIAPDKRLHGQTAAILFRDPDPGSRSF